MDSDESVAAYSYISVGAFATCLKFLAFVSIFGDDNEKISIYFLVVYFLARFLSLLGLF